jgi:DNA repair exonuclease SbcCD ATPase subunit
LLVLDEVLEYVDLEGVEQAVGLIQEIAADLGTVVLCSHNPVFQSYFSQRMYVRIDKEGRSEISETP